MTKVLLMVSVAILSCSLIARGAEGKPTAKTSTYPLKTCVVSDEKLGGDMGDPYIFKYKGREVRLCCKGCLDDFNKEPAKYLKKLDDAEKNAAPKKK